MRTILTIGVLCGLLLQWLTVLAADDTEVKVRLGKGQAHVEFYGLEIASDWREEVEKKLRTDRRLADRVVSSAMTEVMLSGEYLDRIGESFQSDSEKAAQKLVELVVLQIQGNRPLESDKGTEVETENRRVVVGGHFSLAENESIEELIILGGRAEIKGKVDRLSVMGGQARIYDTAVVTDELVNVGGRLIIDPGARINRDPYEVMTPNNRTFKFFLDSAQDFNPFQFFNSSIWLWGFRIARMLTLVLLTLLLVRLAPDFFRESQLKVLDNSVNCGVVGFLYVLTYLPIALLMVITILGVSLLPVQFLLTIYLLIVGCGAVMKTLVQKIFRRTNLWNEWMVVILAVMLFEVIGWVPFFGVLVHVGVSLVGVGATFSILWMRFWSSKPSVNPSSVSVSTPQSI